MYNTRGAIRGQNNTCERGDAVLKVPAIRRTTNPQDSDAAVIAVAVERSFATAGIVDARGRILIDKRAELTRSGARSVASVVATLVNELAISAQAPKGSAGAIGVSVPGYIDPNDERVTVPRRPGDSGTAMAWNRAGFKDLMSAELRQRKGGSILLISRTAASIAGEEWCGAARGAANAVFILLGDVIEAGLLVEGRAIRGASGRAGAIGWMALCETFRDGFAQAGCLNVEAGGRSLVRRTIEAWTGTGNSTVGLLSVSDPSDLTAEVVIRAARAGDPLAVEAVKGLCTWLGRGVAGLISTLNPEVVVIGGKLGRALRPFYGDLRSETRQWAEPVAGRDCQIVGAALGEKSALIGAARLAFDARRAS